MSSYWIGVATITGIYLIAILGVSILTGFTGLFSMGHAGFMAIGAYVSALVTKTFGLPFYVGLLCGIFAAIIVGTIVGYSSLRLEGDYFAIATLGLGEVVKLAIENLDSITGGAKGLADIPKGTTLPVVLLLDIVIVILLFNFLNSRHGRNCVAIRENDLASKTIGIDTTRYKVIAMIISCALCGLAGGLLAHHMHYLHPNMFNAVKSNELIMTVILGGQGSITGTILASLILVPLPEFLRFGTAQEWRMVFYGLLVVLVIVFKPSGLFGNRELRLKDIKNLGKQIKKRFSPDKQRGDENA